MWTGGEWHKMGHRRGKAAARWVEEEKEVMPGGLLSSLHLLPLTGSCGTCPHDTSLSAAPYLREDSRISDWESSWHTVMAVNGKFNHTVNNWIEAAQMSQMPAIQGDAEGTPSNHKATAKTGTLPLQSSGGFNVAEHAIFYNVVFLCYRNCELLSIFVNTQNGSGYFWMFS